MTARRPQRAPAAQARRSEPPNGAAGTISDIGWYGPSNQPADPVRSLVEEVAGVPVQSNPGYQDVELALEFVRLRAGDHIGCFYRGDEERDGLVIPVISEALAVECGVIYVCDRDTPEQAAKRLLSDGVDVEGALERQQLHLVASVDAYLADGCFDPDRMVEYYQQAWESSTLAGYPVLCVIGEMSWSLRECPGTERLIEYEANYAHHFGLTPAISLCLYDLDQTGGEQIFDLLRFHTRILLNGIEMVNPSLEDPDFFRAAPSHARPAI